MSQKLSGNLLVVQTGEPAPISNAILAGVITEALKHEEHIGEVYGALNGISGILNEQLVDLAAESQQTVRALSHTPGAALGSSLTTPAAQDLARILSVFAAHDIRHLFVIGDTNALEFAGAINAHATAEKYELNVIAAPASVANDLPVSDHCPGYGSAVKQIAITIRELFVDAASTGLHDTVSIIEVPGQTSGWLAAGAVIARRRNSLLDDAPHILLLPEERFNQQAFIDAVQTILRKQKLCFVVVAEGILDTDGNPPGSNSGTASIGEYLRALVEQNLANVKVASVKLGNVPRSAARNISRTDSDEAFLIGKAAVQASIEGKSAKAIILVREDKDGSGTTYSMRTSLASLEEMSGPRKQFPATWIGEDKMSVGYPFIKYAHPLFQGEIELPFADGLPKFAQLASERVMRKLDAYDAAK